MPEISNLEQKILSFLHISSSEKEAFVHPQYLLADPFLFADMHKAVDRLKTAIDTGESITIYSDYDCDGIPGAVVLRDFFELIGYTDKVSVYIPDRHDEGYGISGVGIDFLQKNNTTLVITIDVGITATKEIAQLQSLGIDVLLTDHHHPLGGDTPDYPVAYAVVHPKKGDYPDKNPCGAGVIFHFIRAFITKYGAQYSVSIDQTKWLLDLVGFATLADMVPLVGENRVLAWYGMLVMRKTKRLGLQTLFLKNNMSLATLAEQDLTFTLAPRLNAASRMDTPMLAFDLLSTRSHAQAILLADNLEKINNERKKLVTKISKEAHSRLDRRELPAIVVIGDLSWRPAVLGLVANKLQETYKRSFFVWGESGDGLIKGSCRMQDEHHAAYLFQALSTDVLLHGGGHQAAGGFAVEKEKIHFLEAALNEAIAVVGHVPEEKNTSLAIPIELAAVHTKALSMIRSFAPFGVGNPEPVFLFENVVIESVKMFGKHQEHIEIAISDMTGRATGFMFFASEDIVAILQKGAKLSLTGVIVAGWKGGVRIHIKEICK